jgi:hypothetical protein
MKCKSIHFAILPADRNRINKLLTITFVFLTKKYDIFSSKPEILYWTGVCINNFRYHEACGMRKCEMTKEKEGAQREAAKLGCLDRRIHSPSCRFLKYFPSFKTPESGLYTSDFHYPFECEHSVGLYLLKKIHSAIWQNLRTRKFLKTSNPNFEFVGLVNLKSIL